MNASNHLDLSAFNEPLLETRKKLNSIILGKSRQIDLAICCLLAQGHLLLEDVPGVGKTTLALAIAKVFGLGFQRIQFTSDLLPADILGVSIFNAQTQQFNFHKGAIFTQCLLADEVNRSTPKTQSALLEAMEEQQISIEGDTYKLPKPFFVIATQNPLDQSGTFPLPESQLDRFMMCLELGYPTEEAEFNLYAGSSTRDLIEHLRPLMHVQLVAKIQQSVSLVHTSEPLIKYIQRLIAATRQSQLFSYGLSPRAGLAVVQASKAWALIHNRSYVEPDDVKHVFAAIAVHRLVPLEEGSKGCLGLIETLLDEIPIP